MRFDYTIAGTMLLCDKKPRHGSSLQLSRGSDMIRQHNHRVLPRERPSWGVDDAFVCVHDVRVV